jgi:hypothetical protein
MNRTRACDAVRRPVAPHRQVQPFVSGCGLGSRRISPSIDQLCVCGAAAIPPCAANCRQPDAVRESRSCHRSGQPLRWTTPKVDQVPNTEAFANLPQLGSGGRKETAHQRTPAELFHSDLPALSATPEPRENPGQLRRDRRLSLAKESILRSLCFLLFKVGLHRVGSASRFCQRA